MKRSPLHIAILSRASHLYSTQSLFRAVRRNGHKVKVVDFLECDLLLGTNSSQVLYEGRPLRGVDGIIPRVGASVTRQGAAVIRQFELMGVATVAQSDALLRARNKLRAFQELSHAGMELPRTVFSHFSYEPEALVEAVGGLPVVIKLLQGTHGMGVLLVENMAMAISIMETFFKTRQRFVVQEFIQESKGRDLRALVVDGKVVAAMKRQARGDEFRANLHRGGRGVKVKLTQAQEAAALKSAHVLGLQVAGVDMLESERGPLLLEVNASPGLEGIETITRVNVAKEIVHLLERLAAR